MDRDEAIGVSGGDNRDFGNEKTYHNPVVGQMHGGTVYTNGGKDKVIEMQEERVHHMFEAFMAELRGFREYIVRQDDYIKRQDDHLKRIVRNSYMRNERNMERIDNIMTMMNNDQQKSREQMDRMIAILEKKI